MEESLKIVLQDGNKDCGICALLSIIRYYGGDVSKEYLREITNTTKSGVSFYHLLQGAISLGFSGEGVRGDLSNINQNNLPCLAHFIVNKSYQHFVTIYSIDHKKGQVILMDPAKGKRVLSFAEFRLLSSNYFLYLHPAKPIPKFMRKRNILSLSHSFFQIKRKQFIMLVFLSILSLYCQIVGAFHLKYLLETGVMESLSSNVLIITSYIFFFYLFQIVIDLLRGVLLGKLMCLFDEKATTYVYQQILLLPYLFFKNRTIGEIVARIRDLSTVKEFFFKSISFIVSDFLILIVFSIFLFCINKILTILIFIYFFCSFLFVKVIYSRKQKYVKKYQLANDAIQSFLIESFESVDTIKGLHLEHEFCSKFKMKYQRLLSRFYQTMKLLEKEQAVKNGFYFLLYLFLYAAGSYLIVLKKLSITDFIIYQGIFNYLMISFGRISNIVIEIPQMQVALERVEELFTITTETFVGGHYYSLGSLLGDIEYCQLSYGYSSTLLFDRVNLFIRGGSKVLLTGDSGSGKSSLVKMLMRYIEIPAGMLKVNGIDINHYHLDLLRKRVSYVTGNELLFSNTIHYNIALGREVSEEVIDKISKLVMVDEIVGQNTLGYQRMVEENGFNFSGGERQRIVLARTLLKDSDIFIFDEAFNQIDIDKEKQILLNVFEYLKAKTVIIISHRFANSDLFDYQFQLKEGKIYETKTI